MDWSKIVEWIKLSRKYLLPVSFFNGMLLFLNPKRISFFGLEGFVNKYLPWINSIYILLIGLLSSHLIFQLINSSKKRIKNKIGYARMTKMFSDLT